MSKEQVKEFFIKLEQDKKLQEKCDTALKRIDRSDEDILGSKLIELGKDAGFEFSLDDLKATKREMMDQLNENEELNDDALKSVAGGSAEIHSKTAGIIVTVAAAYVCAIASLAGEIERKGGCKQDLSFTNCQ